MGLVVAEISLSNPKRPDSDPVRTTALADSGALHLCIPQELADALELEQLDVRRVSTADGETHECPYVGPVLVRACGRECFTGAIVLGTEVLLGAVPMEDMDLWVSPAQHQLVTNPASPDVPLSVAKGLRRLSR